MKFSNEQVRKMRELASMGMRRREICLQFQISGGQLDRILAGTSRLGAGGAISDGALPDRRPDIEKINEMTVEQFNQMVEKGRDIVPAKKVFIPELDRQLRPKEDWSIEGMKKKLAQLRGEAPDESQTEVSPSGIPLPPDWMENYGGQDERRPNDPNELLDELMKK